MSLMTLAVSDDWGWWLSTSVYIFRDVASSGKICFFSTVELSALWLPFNWSPAALFLLYSSMCCGICSSKEPSQSCHAWTGQWEGTEGWSCCLLHIYFSSSVFYFPANLGMEKGEKVARTQQLVWAATCRDWGKPRLGKWIMTADWDTKTIISFHTLSPEYLLRKTNTQKTSLKSTNSMGKAVCPICVPLVPKLPNRVFSKRKPNDDGCIGFMSKHLCSSW